jgi:hypothetical protein
MTKNQMSKEQKKYYKEYKELEDKIDNHLDRFQIFQSREEEGDVIHLDMKAGPYAIRKQMEKCIMSDEEKEDVEKKISEFRSLIGRKTGLKRKCDPLSSKNRLGRKLNTTILDLRRTEILELFGRCKTIDDVYKIVKEEWGYELSQASIRKFYTENKEQISELKNKYITSYSDIAVTKKTSRIERLAYLLDEQTEKFSEHKQISHSKEIRAILEQVRKEVEEEEIKLTIEGKVDVKANIGTNIAVKELLGKVNINDTVVAMVAAKRGLDPQKFMRQFTNSFYKDFNGFSPHSEFNKKGIKIDLPSNHVYDWDEIARKHKMGLSDNIEDAKMVEDPATEKTENIRTQLLAMLEEDKKELREARANFINKRGGEE